MLNLPAMIVMLISIIFTPAPQQPTQASCFRVFTMTPGQPVGIDFAHCLFASTPEHPVMVVPVIHPRPLAS